MNQKKMKCLATFTFLFCSASWGANSDPESTELQNELNGGADRPVEVYVRRYKNAFLLEGSVDRFVQRENAQRSCQLHAGYQELYKKNGFKSAEEMCVSRIRIRPGVVIDPPSSILVEYKLLFLPDTDVSAAALMELDYREVTETTKKALLLASSIVQLSNDNEATYRQPASAEENATSLKLPIESSETLRIDARAKGFLATDKDFVFASKSHAFSFAGTDKISLSADIVLREKDGTEPVVRFKTDSVFSNATMRPIGIVTKLNGKTVPTMILLARVSKKR